MAQPPPKQQKTNPLAAFAPEAFAKLIQGRGLTYFWRRALTCPCRLNTDTDQWDPTCGRCGGDGWMHVNPYASRKASQRDYVKIKAVFSSVKGDPTVEEVFGSWDNSTATLTVQSEMRVGFRDRFIGVEQELAWTELLFRGAADKVQVGRYGLPVDRQREAMRYEPIRVNYIEDDDGSGNHTIYYKGLDWRVVSSIGTEPRHLLWLPGKGPPEGRLYTIHYDIHPVWVVDDGVFNIQNSVGPEAGLKGSDVLQHLPTTFKVALDFLTGVRTT